MPITTICSVCHRTENLDGWLDQFIEQYKMLSRSYCQECFARKMHEYQLNPVAREGVPARSGVNDLPPKEGR